MDFGRKRGNPDTPFVTNGGIKRSKEERDSFATGIGSNKSKPCTKFFSTSGCSFGGECHFQHYVPGGYTAMTQMTNMGGNPYTSSGRNPIAPSHFTDGPAPTVKTKLCNKFNTAEGCKFGDKCRFAHGEMEIGRPSFSLHEGMGPKVNRFSNRSDLSQHGLAAAANFGASATAKISIDASLAGAVIGKAGVNSKQICRLTGVKFVIKEHDTDPNQRNIELEGTFDQIKHASSMVGELIMNIGAAHAPPPPPAKLSLAAAPANNFKTKVCEHFAKGSCTFGEKCHFAHGDDELRKSAA